MIGSEFRRLYSVTDVNKSGNVMLSWGYANKFGGASRICWSRYWQTIRDHEHTRTANSSVITRSAFLHKWISLTSRSWTERLVGMASFAAFKSWLRIDRQFIFLKLAYFLVYSGNLIASICKSVYYVHVLNWPTVWFSAWPYVNIISTEIVSYQQLAILFAFIPLISIAMPIIVGNHFNFYLMNWIVFHLMMIRFRRW